MSDREKLMHDFISELKRLHLEFGHVPTRDFFRANASMSDKIQQKLFPTWKDALAAAGLSQPKPKELIKQAVDSLLLKSIDDLSGKSFSPKRIFGPYEKAMAIGDIHEPWGCDASKDEILNIASAFKPKYIVVMGDAYDFFAQSKFPKRIRILPEDEVKTAQDRLANFFKRISSIAPQAKIYMLRGNHDIRPAKRLIESAPDLLPFFDFDKFFKFENVETIFDTREPLILDGIAYHHGFMSHGRHMKKFGRPTVTGHFHHGKLTVDKIDSKWLWEMDCGYIGDISKPCFDYTPVKEGRWTRGVGLITEWGPHFVPFE